jgi:hypothetical protein
MLARRHHDAEPGAGGDVDVRIDAALADQPELGQPRQQRLADLGALPDQHQCFGLPQPRREHVVVLDMIGPHRDLMAGELAEAGERSYGIMVVIEYCDLHEFARPIPAVSAGPGVYIES